MIHLQNAKVNTWSVTSTTIGACGLIGVVILGSAALNTITIQDVTTIKMVLACQITANNVLSFTPPIAFTSLNTVVTGTPAYSVVFVPRP